MTIYNPDRGTGRGLVGRIAPRLRVSCRTCHGDRIIDDPATRHLHPHDPAKGESIDCPDCTDPRG